VAAAYKRLAMAGIAVTQGRLGTIIRDQYEPGEQEGTLAGSPLTDLASGNPNIEWLPDISAALQSRPYKPRLYGEPTVNAGLEAYARKWFSPTAPRLRSQSGAWRRRCHRAAAQRVSVAGDKVAVENPCFLSSINMLRAIGLQPIGVPVDAEGIQAEGLASARPGAQAVILTLRAQPDGLLPEREAGAGNLAIAGKASNVPVIVDDHFALLSGAAYHPVIPRTLSLGRGAVLHKALGPDLRVAAVASDVATSAATLVRARNKLGQPPSAGHRRGHRHRPRPSG
jgi:hypothetical protein